MENEEMKDSESNKEIAIPKPATDFQQNVIDKYYVKYCDFCSKTFKSKSGLYRHMKRIHKDEISKDQQPNTVESYLNELKTKYDTYFLGIGDALNWHTGYIHKNADNVMDLLNTQNQHNAQIKKITE